MAIKKNNIIEKRNILNEIRCNNMHLQELRFFTIYLSKINARNPEGTRLVRFPLSDFLSIMELKKANIADLKQTTNSLLCKVVNVPLESGGYRAFQLFKECTIDKDKNTDIWYIEIDAHDRALPLMFDFKKEYFTYELWNALRLTSSNQLRMYEILKQYQKGGERIYKLEDLRGLLFIGENEYLRFDNFKSKVLDACQKALKENTDICFEYELIKKGKGGKVSAIKFTIFKNKDYTDQLTLNEFIDLKSDVIDVEAVAADETQPLTENTDLEDVEDDTPGNENLELLAGACNNEFSFVELQVLYNLIVQIVPYSRKGDTLLKRYDYLQHKYDEVNWRASKTKISNRFGYLKKIVEADIPE